MRSATENWEVFLNGVSEPAAWARAHEGPSALAAALEEAVAAWPSIALDPAIFVRHLAERSGPDGDPAILQALCLGDLYLACACLRGDPAAIQAFDRQFISHIPTWLASLRTTPSLAEEIQQDLRARLLVGTDKERARLGDYAGRGALRVWLRAAAVRAALTHLRSAEVRKRAPADDTGWLDRVPSGGDPQLDIAKRIDGRVFQAALRDALGALDAEQRNLLRMHYIDGLTVEQLGAAFRVHKSTASRRIKEAREAIAEGARRLLGQRLQLRPEEVDSLGGLLHSQIDLSLARIL